MELKDEKLKIDSASERFNKYLWIKYKIKVINRKRKTHFIKLADWK